MSPLIRHGARNLLTWGLLGAGGLIILGYTLFEFRGLIQGPQIQVLEPANGASVPSAYNLTGKTDRISSLFLNGRLINVDEEGRFGERLVAPEGSFILTLAARDRFGRETITRLSLYGHAQESSESQGTEISTSTDKGTEE
jgi:hypothetical protein